MFHGSDGVFVVVHRLWSFRDKPHVHTTIEIERKCKCCRAVNRVCRTEYVAIVAGTVAWMACVLLLLLLSAQVTNQLVCAWEESVGEACQTCRRHSLSFVCCGGDSSVLKSV